MIIASIPDFREAAKRRLPHFLFEYIDGGSYAEVTLGRNITDLESIALRQRVLRDISQIDTSHRTVRRQAGLAGDPGPDRPWRVDRAARRNAGGARGQCRRGAVYVVDRLGLPDR